MRQITLACQPIFEKYARTSRREQSLNSMDVVVPWAELEALSAPYYPKASKVRQPIGSRTMLPICFLLDWFNPSHAPDETTILNFRHLLETHALCGQFTVWCN